MVYPLLESAVRRTAMPGLSKGLTNLHHGRSQQGAAYPEALPELLQHRAIWHIVARRPHDRLVHLLSCTAGRTSCIV